MKGRSGGQRQGAGRKPVTGEARTHRVTFFLEDEEMAKLQGLADAQGVKPGRAAYLIVRRALRRRP